MANVVISHDQRVEGSSGYSFKKLFGLWMNGFTAFSEKPLRLAAIIGWITAFLGFLYGIFIIVRKIVMPGIAVGYSSIMAVMLFLCGMRMLLSPSCPANWKTTIPLWNLRF